MKRPVPYQDRHDAGRVLGRKVVSGARPDSVVLGLPRGGVPVAVEVARALHAPLDVFLVRKLGVPDHPELAMGAIASGDVQVMNESVVAGARITSSEIAATVAREQAELHRREQDYRRGHPALPVAGRHVILVDDGLATGASMRAAVRAVRRRVAASILVAVPVGAAETCVAVAAEVDGLVCPLCLDEFYAVGAWYEDFRPTTDDEVRASLETAAAFAESAHWGRRHL